MTDILLRKIKNSGKTMYNSTKPISNTIKHTIKTKLNETRPTQHIHVDTYETSNDNTYPNKYYKLRWEHIKPYNDAKIPDTEDDFHHYENEFKRVYHENNQSIKGSSIPNKKSKGSLLKVKKGDQYKNHTFSNAEILALKTMLVKGRPDEKPFLNQIETNKTLQGKFTEFKGMFPYILSSIDLLNEKLGKAKKTGKGMKRRGGADPDPEDEKIEEGKDFEIPPTRLTKSISHSTGVEPTAPVLPPPKKRGRPVVIKTPDILESDREKARERSREYAKKKKEREDELRLRDAEKSKIIERYEKHRETEPDLDLTSLFPYTETFTETHPHSYDKVVTFKQDIEDEIYSINQKLFKLIQQADAFFNSNIKPNINDLPRDSFDKLNQFINALKIKGQTIPFDDLQKLVGFSQVELITSLLDEFLYDLEFGINSYNPNVKQTGGVSISEYYQPIRQEGNMNRTILQGHKRPIDGEANWRFPIIQKKRSEFLANPPEKFISLSKYDPFKTRNIIYQFPPGSGMKDFVSN